MVMDAALQYLKPRQNDGLARREGMPVPVWPSGTLFFQHRWASRKVSRQSFRQYPSAIQP